MTFADRVQALEPLGFTPRQTRFLVTVAIHSGYCLRRQYSAFAGIRYGKNVCEFLDTLVTRGLAVRFTQRADRGHIYHLQARAVYRALGEADNRNRRTASSALVARKLMVLDYVLAHQDVEWLASEADKVALCTTRYGVPLAALPQRVFPAPRGGGAATTRYFLDKLPVADAVVPASAVQFVYLATDGTGDGFARFLADHERLIAQLPAWRVVAVSPSPSALTACERVFGSWHAAPREVTIDDRADREWFFAARQAVDRGEWARLAVAEIDRFRTLRARFVGAEVDAQYAEWCARGAVAVADESGVSRAVGQLVTERLPYDYRQFGSLPGVA